MKISKFVKRILIILLMFILSINIVIGAPISEYREVLANSDKDINYFDNNKSTIAEWLVKSDVENVEFIRHRFDGVLEKSYFGRDLITTSQYKVFNGTRQVRFRNINPFIYNEYFGDGKGKVIQNIDYFIDSRKTRYFGTLRKTIIIDSNKFKTKIEFFPKDSNVRANIRWEIQTEDLKQSRNFLKEDIFEYTVDKGLKLSWNDASEKVTSARKFLNGKIRVIYKSSTKYQLIDPEIINPDGDVIVNESVITPKNQKISSAKLDTEFKIIEDWESLTKKKIVMKIQNKQDSSDDLAIKIHFNETNLDALATLDNVHIWTESEEEVNITDYDWINNKFNTIEIDNENGTNLQVILEHDNWTQIEMGSHIEIKNITRTINVNSKSGSDREAKIEIEIIRLQKAGHIRDTVYIYIEVPTPVVLRSDGRYGNKGFLQVDVNGEMFWDKTESSVWDLGCSDLFDLNISNQEGGIVTSRLETVEITEVIPFCTNGICGDNLNVVYDNTTNAPAQFNESNQSIHFPSNFSGGSLASLAEDHIMDIYVGCGTGGFETFVSEFTYDNALATTLENYTYTAGELHGAGNTADYTEANNMLENDGANGGGSFPLHRSVANLTWSLLWSHVNNATGSGANIYMSICDNNVIGNDESPNNCYSINSEREGAASYRFWEKNETPFGSHVILATGGSPDGNWHDFEWHGNTGGLQFLEDGVVIIDWDDGIGHGTDLATNNHSYIGIISKGASAGLNPMDNISFIEGYNVSFGKNTIVIGPAISTSSNTAPNAPTGVIMNSTLFAQLNRTDENLTANFLCDDPDASDTLTFDLQFYENGIVNISFFGESCSDPEYVQLNLTSENTTKGEVWSFSVNVTDDDGASSSTVFSNNITITNFPPDEPPGNSIILNNSRTGSQTQAGRNDILTANFGCSDNDTEDTLTYDLDLYNQSTGGASETSKAFVQVGVSCTGNPSYMTVEIHPDNLSIGQRWRHSANITDQDGGTSGTTLGNQIDIIDYVPTDPVLHLPLNATNFSFMPVFNWSNSTDEDGDVLFYYFEVASDVAFTNVDFYFPDKQEVINTTGITGQNLINLTSDAALFMTFEQNTTYPARDYSSNNNSANISSNIFYNATGGYKDSGAYEFDKVDDIIITPDSASLDGMAELTLEAWIKLTTSADGGAIISRYGASAGDQAYNLVANSGFNKIRIDIRNQGLTQNNVLSDTTLTTLNDGNFHHIVFVYNGSDMRLYTDGLLDSTPKNHTGNIRVASTNGLGTGIGGSPLATSLFNGTIDEVGIYRRAFSADEVLRSFEQGNPAIDDGTYFYRVNGTDNSNDSSYSEIRQFTLDTIIPSVEIVDTPLNITYNNNETGLNWSYEDATFDSAWYRFNDNETNYTLYGNLSIIGEFTGNEPGLVAYYNFNTDARDITNNGNDGTIIGAVCDSTISGQIGNGCEFDGVNDRIEVTPNIVAGVPFTIEVWIKGSSTGTERIITNTQTVNGEMMIDYNNNGRIRFRTQINDTGNDITKTTTDLNVWHHIVGTVDSGGNKVLYVDGINEGTASVGTQEGNSVTDFFIGQRVTGGGENFNGTIDEVRIYDRALSSGEVLENYNRQTNLVREGGNFIQVFANDSFNKVNQTNVSWMVDTLVPLWTDNSSLPESPRNFGGAIEFNITFIDANPDTIILVLNNTNFTQTFTSGEPINFTFDDLTVGDHSFYFEGNDSANNFNRTEDYSFTIQQADDIGITLELDGIAADRKYEFQTLANITALLINCTGCEIQLDISHPDFGVNFSQGIEIVNLSFRIPETLQINFTDPANQKFINLSLAAGQSQEINITLDLKRTVLSDSFNITGHAVSGSYPTDITIDLGGDGLIDIVLPGTLFGNTLNLDSLIGGITVEAITFAISQSLSGGLPPPAPPEAFNQTAEVLSFTTAGTEYRFANYSSHNRSTLIIENLTFQLVGQADNSEEANFTELFLDDTQIINNITVTIPNFFWENWNIGEILGRWSGDFEIVDTLYLHSSGEVFGEDPVCDVEDIVEQRYFSQTINLTQYNNVEVDILISAFAEAGENSNTGACTTNIARVNSEFGLRDNTAGTHTSVISCSVVATRNQGSPGATVSNCTLEYLVEFRTNGSKIEFFNNSEFIGDFSFDPTHSYEIYGFGKIFDVSGKCNGACPVEGPSGTGSRGLFNITMRNITAAGARGDPQGNFTWRNGTFESTDIANFSSNLASARLTARDNIPEFGSIRYFLTADNSTFEEVQNGITHVFSTTGTTLRYKVEINGTDKIIVNDNETTIFDINIIVAQGLPSNITIDVGGDGNADFTWNGELGPDNGTVEVNISSNIVTQYIVDNCPANQTLTCEVPIGFTTGSSGTLKYQGISLNTTLKDGFHFGVDNLTSMLDGNAIINLTAVSTSDGIIQFGSLRFGYIGEGNISILAHFDGNENISAASILFNITGRYSPFTFDFPIDNITINQFQLAPANLSSINVEPFGQKRIFCDAPNLTLPETGFCANDSIGIWNLTSLALTDPLSVYISYNSSANTAGCANITVDIDPNFNTTELQHVINLTQYRIGNITLNNSIQLYTLTNFTCTSSTLRTIQPIFNVESWCESCVLVN